MSSQKLTIILENSQGGSLLQCSLEKGPNRKTCPLPQGKALRHKSEREFRSFCVQGECLLPQAHPRNPKGVRR